MIPLATLYQLRSELEDGPQPGVVPGGIAGALANLEFTVLTRTNSPLNFQQARPRLEIKTEIGAATGAKQFRITDQQMVFSAWRFRLAVQAITAPASDGKNALHEEYLGTVRAVMSTFAQGTWADTVNFPNVLIAEPLKDNGTQSNLKDDQGVEYSVLSYDGIVMVRPGVW